ncbi:mRNA capping enzyme alpha subunit [Linderina pennispora]|uniref:mRNA guanylyltransferase n=1 Tax=Linderina pennispora TaxID=61395 RepID=A0A1Y1VYG2_9FUNG|nr:mRNA capping enzyme alpha subunit [Linderina pennispora]ORX66075.1 mRNA capping enzyme alpha subunit [Linderina pennispora]
MSAHVPIPDIPGVRVPFEETKSLRRRVGDITNTGKFTFPGSQPVSFTKTQAMAELMTSDYLVCEKSDGVRVLVLMLFDKDMPQTFFATRKNEYFYVRNVAFPAPYQKAPYEKYHHNTLIDAELVVDVEADGRRVMKLLGFDALVINGKNIMNHPLDRRLDYLNRHVIAPYQEMCRTCPAYCRGQPFMAEFKRFENSFAVQTIQREVIPKLKHESDGLVFTSRVAPYTPGTCDKIMKWKPAGENSIDFRVRVIASSTTSPPEIELLAWHGGNDYRPFAKMAMRPEDWDRTFSRISSFSGSIVEVSYTPDYCPPHVWKFMRFRNDKPHGNHISVVDKIIASINDSMELDELLAEMPRIRTEWMKRNNAPL